MTPQGQDRHVSGITPRTSVIEWWRNDTNSMNDTGVVAGPAAGQTSHTHRLCGLAGTGFVATPAAMVATTLAAALAQAVGGDFEVPDGGETSRCPGSPW